MKKNEYCYLAWVFDEKGLVTRKIIEFSAKDKKELKRTYTGHRKLLIKCFGRIKKEKIFQRFQRPTSNHKKQ